MPGPRAATGLGDGPFAIAKWTPVIAGALAAAALAFVLFTFGSPPPVPHPAGSLTSR
jgi:hypothetical protein